MPDGDKGGNYFALGGTILQKVACLPTCGDLRSTVTTGQPGWILNKAPGLGAPKAAVVVSRPTAGWGSIPGASWISIDANGGNASGSYEFVYAFCLCPGARNLNIVLDYLADNGVQIYLNNKLLTSTTGDRNFVAPPKNLNYSTVVGSGDAVVGTNRIRMVVSNEGSVTGLLARLQLIAPGGACSRGVSSEALGQ
ncbi:MAG: hypothetical protein K2X03_20985 [Bryobacteraceae bacterium]|nr:hypothetical protein [Bryobacteraceae bacterium]